MFFVQWHLRVLRQPTERQDVIYAITAREIGMVKLGYSKNPKARLYALRVNMPFRLELEKASPGTRVEERLIHEKLKCSRFRGEWFHLSEKVENHIKEMNDIEQTDKEKIKNAKDAEIKALYESGEKLKDIGLRYGVSRQRIDQVVKYLGLPRRGRVSASSTWDKMEEIKRLAGSGLTLLEISKEINVPSVKIRAACRSHGIEVNRKPRVRSPETQQKAEEIAIAYLSGENTLSIAKRYGIEAARIYRYLRYAGVKPNRVRK